ncbi:ABC-type amino acid transport/signal transduction system, periplasmic component [Rubidibacter lacunae KORDI 51-2]|uniref:ABC-type amino acid transport/signal transduction system, periplasmic component n=1 Tax=Rubidibacter lacunae KORDI 51-2 TaxID=582515 RepID=U5D536_9CHRO|nr:amino acid ABC transporter substrate-binding protein [Rubidibacter lacunae]ERN39798.1 ABC-type amino acid transport/signal transduction system, periplasmic component [Rubidibacter lacunae KORDI 51-2]
MNCLWLGVIALLGGLWGAVPVQAGVLDRVAATGTLVVGARQDSVPFGYIDADGQWVGFSLEILELVRLQTERELGRPVQLELVVVTPQDRFDKIENGSIAIECGSTTITWDRDRRVDFSLSYFISGTQLLAPVGNALETISDLAGKRIGVVPETSNAANVRTLQPAAELVPVGDRATGLSKLEAGEIDAFASDGIMLAGLRAAAAQPLAWEVVPDRPLQEESYACSLPEDDSRWRDLVNFAIARYLQGVISDRLEMVDIYEQWFGESGVLPYPREAIDAYYSAILYSVEWIPFGSELY